MESFKVENLSFSYPKEQEKALDGISFSVKTGEFVLVCGKSGCGKTTLLRLLKPTLAPCGIKTGEICCFGRPACELSDVEQAAKIGFVLQNPDNGLVTDKVWHELAFGLESLGLKTPEIRTRVSEMASYFGIQNWFYKNVSELSGGQKQILNLASVMAMGPSVLILDEPTSQLDPIAAQEFLSTLKKINRELGVTVILSEHRLEEGFAAADRVIVMDSGKIVADDSPCQVDEIIKESNPDIYSAFPTPVRVHGSVKSNLPCPVSVREGRVWLEKFSESNRLYPGLIPKDKEPTAFDTVIEFKDVWFRYEKDQPDIVKGLSFSVKKGELFCILGGNGCGKTTVLSLISGINKPYRGKISINGENILKAKNLYSGLLGVLPQNPQTVFLNKTVRLDLMGMLPPKLPREEKNERIQKIASLCRLCGLLDKHPYDLSGGEQQRAALAKVLLADPEILLLDEPTKGMDAMFKEEFAEIISDLKKSGKTVIMVSHDIEFCAEYADRCALVFDGSITSEGRPREFFKGKSFYTTSANRMARTSLPDAVLAEDIIKACGGSFREKRASEPRQRAKVTKAEGLKAEKRNKKISKRALISIFSVLILIPLTIYAGCALFGNRKYYFTSLLIIFETMIPFFMLFESRKPKARELIVISVLCALAVAGRAAFFMTPQFKPVIAIIIVSAVCFGSETGFLIGVVTAFVSNFFFGQGPWTPWQMFAFGLIGFLTGALFQNGFLGKSKTTLSVYGFFATLIVYGGIMNPSSVIMSQNKLTLGMLLSSYAAGFPFDLIHSVSTAVFLWLISAPMIEKLERIKLKHGFSLT